MLHRPVALLCTLALGAGMAHAEQTYVLPQVAPGLWQVDMKRADAVEPQTRWFCIQPGHTDLLPLTGREAEQCAREYRAQADDSVTLTMHCELSADEPMDISGVFRGDFAQAYAGEVQVLYATDSSPEPGQIQLRRLGDCTPGVAPCERAGECSDPNG